MAIGFTAIALLATIFDYIQILIAPKYFSCRLHWFWKIP